MVRPRPFPDPDAAEAWLEQVAADRELAAALASDAVFRLNRALHVHRTASGDPHIADVEPSRAAAIRFGYGTGDEVADGRWQRARELPERERRGLLRRDYEALRPQERIAAVLGGREVVGPHEELLVRARGDLDAGRLASAALGLHAGLEALLRVPGLAPPAGGGGDAGADDDLLGRLHEALADSERAREEVLRGAGDGDLERERLEGAVRAGEAAMRRRALG